MEKSMHNFVLRDKLDVWPFGVSHVYISPETDERKKKEALRPSRIWLMHDTHKFKNRNSAEKKERQHRNSNGRVPRSHTHNEQLRKLSIFSSL